MEIVLKVKEIVRNARAIVLHTLLIINTFPTLLNNKFWLELRYRVNLT